MTDNELIAQFMGLEYIVPRNTHYAPYWRKYDEDKLPISEYRTESLRYHSSWDWIMPVVVKIHQTKKAELVIRSAAVNLSYEGKTKCFSGGMSDLLEYTYLAVVDFIKWYNQNS